MEELLTLHRRALADLDGLVASVLPADLGRRTPCESWRVADLLAHSIGQHRGFAAALREGDAPASAYAFVEYDEQSWRDSVGTLLDTVASADENASVVEVELHPTLPIPVPRVVAAQLLDSAVHAWDLARALGRDYRPDPAVLARVLAGAEAIPDAAKGAGRAFAAAHESGSEDAWERVLLLLGRDPAWSR